MSTSEVMGTYEKREREIINDGRDPKPWDFLYTLPTWSKGTLGTSSLHLILNPEC